MAAFSSTVSATSPNAPGAKRKRKRSSRNLKKPRRKNRKTKSPMLPCPLGKNPPRRNPKRKNRKKRSRKKNPSLLNRAASTRRPFCPGVHCEDHIHHSPYCPGLRRGPRFAWSGIRAIAALHHLRSNPRENFHACRKHHRRRHAYHSRWKNRGGWRRFGRPRGGPGDRRKRATGLPGNLRLDYPDGFAGDRRRWRHCRFGRVGKLQPGRRRGHGRVSLERTHSRHPRGGPPGGACRSWQRRL